MAAEGDGDGVNERREVKLGVIEFHPQPELREYFYRVVKDLTAAGCIVDLWLLDIQSVLKAHGYTMTVHDDGGYDRTTGATRKVL